MGNHFRFGVNFGQGGVELIQLVAQRFFASLKIGKYFGQSFG
jgi:hypothetical protein